MQSTAKMPFFDYSETVLPKRDTAIEYYNSYRISIILTNGMSCVYKDKIFQLTRGDIILFHPSELHFGRVLRAGVHRYIDIFIPLDFSDALTEEYEWLRGVLSNSLSKKVHHISPDEKHRGDIIRISERLSEIYKESSESLKISAFSDIFNMISICCELYRKPELAPDGKSVPAILRSALKYITENYAEIKSTAEISQKIGCSMTYLSRLFRKYTGDTVLSYLTDYRLQQAKRRLASGASVTDACFGAGFGDCSHFIKVFKKQEGTTPLVYQKKIQHGR